ncbi:NAD(P)-binding protein [Dichomitus squalens LYAD-421 SS1]|uniref:NAD(P)-binding protein n=2 Tax=Dichomitus squalens TaxID=114155 RepID=A0A4V2JYX7_9APHY|nr:NAD(P)-binding protein [Dichomitus squalens LYAD-421 SS1]EJF55689.1 NAD(P)-binding protein [Dichomitus squalens LYAD-421 SS1]TBU22763.1 NAD(P)-binding protein [Dichomitus squalens]
MAGKISIFVTGVTGYIGGTLLVRLLNHPDADTFDITALVRNPEKAHLLESKFGVKTLIASHAEHDRIEEAVAANHIILQISDSDDEPLTKAILRGLKRRHDKIGDLPILIHTSGTGLLIDDARGEYPTETIYSDLNVEQLKSIPPTAYHRNVDLLVVGADEEGYARTHIVIPSTVYGIATHPLVKAGISNPHSIQIPSLIRFSLARKRAGVIGKGLSLWPNVHIDDTADIYIVLLDSILHHPDTTGHGWEGLYFGESGEHRWLDISLAIGRAMYELGLADSPEPTPFSHDEILKYFGSEWRGYLFGTNSRARADRTRALGWKPKHSTEDLLASIKPEVEVYAKKQ